MKAEQMTNEQKNQMALAAYSTMTDSEHKAFALAYKAGDVEALLEMTLNFTTRGIQNQIELATACQTSSEKMEALTGVVYDALKQ